MADKNKSVQNEFNEDGALIALTDENGKEVVFEILGVVDYDNDEFAVLIDSIKLIIGVVILSAASALSPIPLPITTASVIKYTDATTALPIDGKRYLKYKFFTLSFNKSTMTSIQKTCQQSDKNRLLASQNQYIFNY